MFSPPYPSALVNANGDGYVVWETSEPWTMGIDFPLTSETTLPPPVDLGQTFEAERYPVLAPLGTDAMLLTWLGWALQAGVRGRAIDGAWNAVSEEFVLAGPDELVETWPIGTTLEPIAMGAVGPDRVAIVWSASREVDDTPLYPKGDYILAVVVP